MTSQHPTNGWLAQVAMADEIAAHIELVEARKVEAKPSTYDRRKRIERHIAQAHYYTLRCNAFRELLDLRQRIDKAFASQSKEGETK